VHDARRRGKKRLRLDIEIIQSQSGSRPRFRFEAKRLRDAPSRREYLGVDGLGCFLDGRYAADNEVAGMLGYVQADTIPTHTEALQQLLATDSKKYGVLSGDQWVPTKLATELPSFRTSHRRNRKLADITIFHSFLDFR
jgi:hypothetical protein